MDLKKLSEVRSPVLLCGETGTGKSRFARLIHENSTLKNKRFVTVHLSSLSEELLESELFGHIKGSFTGAIQDKKGYAETVEDGTLFLDEIGELSLEAQKKLLFLLEERRFIPLGSCTEKSFRGRVIAATNKDLKKMVGEGKFREDLFFRLRVFTHTLMPLRENRDTLLELSQEFLCRFAEKLEKPLPELSLEAKRLLLNYPWPGNVRELKNALEYASYSEEKVLSPKDFPSWMEEKSEKSPQQFPLDYHQALEEFEKCYFQYVARYFQGKINHTARELKISKSTLIAKFHKYQVNIWQIRAEQRMAA